MDSEDFQKGLKDKRSLRDWFIDFKDRLRNGNLGWQLLIGCICWLALACFFHFREVKLDPMEPNSISQRYVVAQVDFDYPDDEATFFAKQNIINGIGTIYKVTDNGLSLAKQDFENYLIHDSGWQSLLSDVYIEDIYRGMDYIRGEIQKLRFTDRNTKIIMKNHNLPTKDFFIFLSRNKERIVFSTEVWHFLKKQLKEENSGINPKIADVIFSFFEKRSWQLEEDTQGEANIRKQIEGSIPTKYTKVKAGSKFISKGEKVSNRHLAMLKAMKAFFKSTLNHWNPLRILGNLLLSLSFILVSFFYLKKFQKSVVDSVQKLSLLVCVFTLTLFLAKIIEYILLQGSGNLIDLVKYPVFVPFASILIFILLKNVHLALYVSFIISVVCCFGLTFNRIAFLVINVLVAIIIIITTKTLRKRKEIFLMSGKGVIVSTFIILAFKLFFVDFSCGVFFYDIEINAVFALFIAILVVGLLPLLESAFNVMTDITLVEYMDPNNELLKRLILEVPGTYQHSLVLGNLSEVAAQAIGANGLLCRVATLYHDIGKLNNAHFFTENQQAGVNIHQLLTPQESAQVIISHVRDGVTLAKKYRLPKSIIDIIQQHHGTTLVYYFYQKELELQGGDKSKVNADRFRYPGPKPLTKESAVIMIADSIEAASRAFDKEPTEQDLMDLSDQIVNDRASDGQFDDCNLTFREIKIIKDILVRNLMVSRHVRVKYPKKND